MLNRILPLVAACLVLPLAAGNAAAQPLPAPAPAPPPPVAAVPSGPPGVLDTPDGWHLNVLGSNETQQSVAPLTTALSSREYLVGGTFTGSVDGSGDTKLSGGSLEAGFQIGCGINADDVELIGGAGLTPGIAIPLANNDPVFGASITGQIKVVLKPGTVSIVPVDKKSFKGKAPRITITGFRVKIDGCAGQSFLRSYATLTSSTENTDDVITYLGVTKAV
ncbi:MspA family porin [Mycobacterium sp. NPDC050551]|uniref:MspA family porin n=1 Tax=Mycobacterium sp. NPDC050551 TaxID=3155407 RepID=UPI00341DDE21